MTIPELGRKFLTDGYYWAYTASDGRRRLIYTYVDLSDFPPILKRRIYIIT